MQNNLLTICYDGTGYHGSQIQENAVTIQSEFQSALLRVLGYLPDIKCCSRTDSGVHARMFCISFMTENQENPQKLVMGMNTYLPDDIRVLKAEMVPNDFHARYSSKGKKYEYYVWNDRIMNPFMNNRAFLYPKHLDENALNDAAKLYLGCHDFSSYCSIKSTVEDKERTIREASVRREGKLVVFTFAADGFLYNMVRILVGSLLQYSNGKISEEDIKEYLSGKARDNRLITVPACGLYLTEVYY